MKFNSKISIVFLATFLALSQFGYADAADQGKKAGEKIDHVVDKAKEKGREVADAAKEKAKEAKQSAKDAHEKAKEKAHKVIEKS